jgi:amino acid transporter
MFNVLMMSYTRLPVAMAEDGMLPRFVTRRNSRGVPYISVVLCAIAWALALNLPFERLISIDLVLYGASLILEFVALVVLRLREPNLERPFKAGNFAVACALGVGPTALIAYALYRLARRACRQLPRAALRLPGRAGRPHPLLAHHLGPEPPQTSAHRGRLNI